MDINFMQLDKKKVTTIIAVCTALIGISYGAYAYLPLATGGSYSVTQRDVATYRDTMKQLVTVTGEGEVPSYSDALKTITATYAQYDLLKKKGIMINQDRANALIESSSPLKGILKNLRSNLGDERYFFTVTLPAAIGQPFNEYYSATDPKGEQARSILQNAIAASLASAAEKAGLKSQDITITNTPDTASFFDAASKSIGKPIEKIIDNGPSFLIVQPRERLENKILATALIVPKTPAPEFFMAELKKANIPMQVKLWTVYSDNKFFTPPPAPVDAKKEDANAQK